MWTWFLLQKKQTKILIISGLAVLLIILYFAGNAAYWKYQHFKVLEAQNKELINQNKQLQKDFQALYIQRKQLDKALDRKNKTIDSLKTIAKKLKDEQAKIPDRVRNYPDKQLDSILSNYRHITKSEN